MAQISVNSFLREVRGSLENIVVRKIRGQYFISRKPKPGHKYKPTKSQSKHRAQFRFASEYAKRVQQTPALHAFYAPLAQAQELRVRALAISDWFDRPKVTSVDLRRYRGRAGDPITIQASDKFGVVRVQVHISCGDIHEDGEAVARGKSWRYTATATLPRDGRAKIRVLAYDRPNNSGKMELTWPPETAPHAKS